jgi:hypothetical protein
VTQFALVKGFSDASRQRTECTTHEWPIVLAESTHGGARRLANAEQRQLQGSQKRSRE